MLRSILRPVIRRVRRAFSSLSPSASKPAGSQDKGKSRSEYKAVWNNLSDTEDRAKMHVSGYVEEEKYLHAANETKKSLDATVGIKPDDEILEIGCGVGRVGMVLAPLCKRWTGCDVSGNMLKHAAKRLSKFKNVRLIEISGFDLKPVPDASVDVLYCTVVFMHLEEWDRYNYVLEAYRVLRPGGRIYIDNFSLCSEEGWSVFETHRAIPATQRPPHISKSSTPQEIETYLTKAGFKSVRVEQNKLWVYGWGLKG
ncbi:MAG TPA: class I SAM-dependent methyltransferase [Thermodesulfovibrionales bacterium]|nr:class I SAM-dependent methyltransferase [Thermodesulfovibrionales bacterium]